MHRPRNMVDRFFGTLASMKLNTYTITRRRLAWSVFLLLPLALLACAGDGQLPVGQARAGQTLVISIDEISRVQEVRYRGTDLNHYLIVPTSQDNELVVLRLNVHNAKATRVLMTVDTEAAELRGFEIRETYEIVDVTPTNNENVKLGEGPHPSECLSECFIWGPISLEQGHSVIGQVLFETPKGTKLKELRWVAGDIVHVRS